MRNNGHALVFHYAATDADGQNCSHSARLKRLSEHDIVYKIPLFGSYCIF